MLYTKILQKYADSEFGYLEFRKMYQEIQQALGIDIVYCEDEGRNSDEYRNMRTQIFEWSKSLLVDLHTTDDDVDEYGFLDVVSSYLDAAWRLLAKIQRNFYMQVDAVLYDGEINSVIFKSMKEV